MGRKPQIGIKKTGRPVTLYLNGETAHLYDLAKLNPNITVSHLLNQALQAALGDASERHPMEVMVEDLKADLDEIEKQREIIKQRLEVAQDRLPEELARSEWLKNILGKDGEIRLMNLRTWLFFDARHTARSFIPPKNGREALEEYKQLLSKYESTKRGPTVDGNFEIGDNLHPESKEGFCCEENCMEEHNGKISDDLKFRCELHHRARFAKHWENGVNKLKPHWIEESLTHEQIVLIQAATKGGFKLQKGMGYLVQEENALQSLRTSLIIERATQSWENQNPGENEQLSHLIETKDKVCERDSNANPTKTWEGLPGASNTRLRTQMIQSMNQEERDAYKAKSDLYMELIRNRGESIRTKVEAWRTAGQPWPYVELEDWCDSLLEAEPPANQMEKYPYSLPLNACKSRIELDISIIDSMA